MSTRLREWRLSDIPGTCRRSICDCLQLSDKEVDLRKFLQRANISL